VATRISILKQLKEDMVSYIDPSNTSTGSRKYINAIRDIKRGLYGYDELPQLPAICYTLVRDEVINEFGTSGTRKLYVYLYGYMNTKTYKTDDAAYDGIHSIVEDVEEFLYNDFTYKDSVEVQDIVIHEAGLNFPVSWFEINMTIMYSYNF
jgi:hypothetical protein